MTNRPMTAGTVNVPPSESSRDVQGADFAVLLRRTLLALLACAGLVLLCYLFVDRPVAYFVHDHGLSNDTIFAWLTDPPPMMQAWAPAALCLLMIRRARGPFRRWERVLLAASIAIILADQFRESLADVCGRTWPETWTDNNPSLIRNGVFGFHPFHGGSGYRSFPSGHTARIVAVAAVLWIAWPRSRWLCGLACLAVAVGLIGMNYHFVSDVIAGGFVGAIVATYTACGCGLVAPASTGDAA